MGTQAKRKQGKQKQNIVKLNKTKHNSNKVNEVFIDTHLQYMSVNPQKHAHLCTVHIAHTFNYCFKINAFNALLINLIFFFVGKYFSLLTSLIISNTKPGLTCAVDYHIDRLNLCISMLMLFSASIDYSSLLWRSSCLGSQLHLLF